MPENQQGRENQRDNNGRGNQGSRQGNSLRGLASADQETRERVARAGGKSSHGGGRKSGGGKER